MMQTNLVQRFAVSLLASSALMAGPAAAKSFLIAVPEDMSRDHAADLIPQLMRFAIEQTDPGETSVFLNGNDGTRLCDITVPDRKSYRHTKPKVQANAACLKRLTEYADTQDAGGKTAGRINPPLVLRTIARNYDAAAFDSLILVGPPLYRDDKEPAFTMEHGHVPSDAHIFAAEQLSPYSMNLGGASLADLPVHMLFPGKSWHNNERHKAATRRFWELSIEAIGGQPVTFDNDLAQGLVRAANGAETAPHGHQISDSPKLVMIPVSAARSESLSIYERDVTRDTLPTSQLKNLRDIEIGIRWDCDCDIDLYAQPYKGADILYFRTTRSREGEFFKDYTASPDLLNGFELIAFSAPVDLPEMLVAANFYDGSVPEKVTGEVRLAIGEKTWSAPFEIAATRGNAGSGREDLIADRVAPNAAWTVIDLLGLIGGQ